MDTEDLILPEISEKEFSRLSSLTAKQKATYLLRKRIVELEKELYDTKKEYKEEKRRFDWYKDQGRQSLSKATRVWKRVHPEAKESQPDVSTILNWLLADRSRLIKENNDYREHLGLVLSPRKSSKRNKQANK